MDSCVGFLIATFCQEEVQAVLLAIGTFFPNVILAGTFLLETLSKRTYIIIVDLNVSGMLWPIEGMPVAMQYVGYLLPCTFASESIRSIISRGWSVLHYRVWPGFVSTIAWICVYWVLTIFLHKKFQKSR